MWENSYNENIESAFKFSSEKLEEILTGSQPKQSGMVKTSNCLMLQYHRVALLAYDPLQLAVQAYRFEEQMEYLAENFNVISMDEMRQHLVTSIPFREKSVVVTFDIGYADVLYAAKEILERFKIFATVFVASANIIKKRQFWWDELENFLIANRFCSQLELEMDGRLYDWPLMTQHHRFKAYSDLYSILCDITPAEQNEIIEQITQNLDLQAEELDNHRTMDAQELKKLEESELITIGGHTHNCANLPLLSKCHQIEEVSKNKDILEEVLGHQIDYFSCPFANDYTNETINILKNIGFKLACGNSYGTVGITGQTSCYDLPRVKVGNWSSFTFHKFLERFFE